MNADTDLERVRRRPEEDEFRHFLQAARKGPARFGMAGPERELLYELAAQTDKEPQQREQSHFLAYEDAAGRRFDFHALRHQFASDMAAADVHPKTAQDLTRHSTISLALDHYTHTARGKLASAVARLPDRSQGGEEQARATGTDDVAVAAAPEDPASHSAPHSAPTGTGQGATVRDGALRMPVSGTDALDGASCKTGTYDDVPCTDGNGPGWIRTSDQSIMSRLADGVESDGSQDVTTSGGSYSAPHSAPPPVTPELAELISVWPSLPKHVRLAVMTVIRALSAEVR